MVIACTHTGFFAVSQIKLCVMVMALRFLGQTVVKLRKYEDCGRRAFSSEQPQASAKRSLERLEASDRESCFTGLSYPSSA